MIESWSSVSLFCETHIISVWVNTLMCFTQSVHCECFSISKNVHLQWMYRDLSGLFKNTADDLVKTKFRVQLNESRSMFKKRFFFILTGQNRTNLTLKIGKFQHYILTILTCIIMVKIISFILPIPSPWPSTNTFGSRSFNTSYISGFMRVPVHA